jgi:hypothetical protein
LSANIAALHKAVDACAEVSSSEKSKLKERLTELSLLKCDTCHEMGHDEGVCPLPAQMARLCNNNKLLRRSWRLFWGAEKDKKRAQKEKRKLEEQQAADQALAAKRADVESARKSYKAKQAEIKRDALKRL